VLSETRLDYPAPNNTTQKARGRMFPHRGLKNAWTILLQLK